MSEVLNTFVPRDENLGIFSIMFIIVNDFMKFYHTEVSHRQFLKM